MAITSADYADMLENDWAPATRAALETQMLRAQKLEQQRAALSDQSKRDGLTLRWQQETLRIARIMYAQQFEIDCWRKRERVPHGYEGHANQLAPKLRKFPQRIQRARREAEAGDALQQRFLFDHAELFAALTS